MSVFDDYCEGFLKTAKRRFLDRRMNSSPKSAAISRATKTESVSPRRGIAKLRKAVIFTPIGSQKLSMRCEQCEDRRSE